MTNDTQSPNIAQIRRLLLDAFTAEELRCFCQDRPVFRPVVDTFGPGQGLNEMVGRVIDYCHGRLLWEDLLEEVRKERPRQYERFGFEPPDHEHFPPPPLPPPPRVERRWLWIAVGLVLLLIVAFVIVRLLLFESPPTPEPFDVFDDFDSQSVGSDWCGTEGQIEPTLDNGELVYSVKSDGGFVPAGLKACLEDKAIRTASAKLTLLEAKHQGTAVLEADLDYPDGRDGWVGFGILSNGDLFVVHAPKDGDATYDEKWPAGGLGVPHVLRIEWTKDETRFFADDDLLTSLPIGGAGWWFNVGATAHENGQATGSFDWVGWNYW